MHDLLIEGLLVNSGDEERVRVVVNPYYLDVDRDDVVDIEELTAPPGLIAERALAVRVRLRGGARLRGFAMACSYAAILWAGRRTFALATAADLPGKEPDALGDRLEDEFLRRRGLRESRP